MVLSGLITFDWVNRAIEKVVPEMEPAFGRPEKPNTCFDFLPKPKGYI